jgi:thymidylate kinase
VTANHHERPDPRAAGLPPPIAGLIAVVGCDGTGKSTLTHDLVKTLGRDRPAERRYLGLVSGETGDAIKRLPLIGPRLERRLAAKAAHAQDMKNKLPNMWGALVMYGLSLWRAAHLRRVIRLAERGVLVITDRYPQAEITGFRYDGPGLGIERSTHWLVRRLAAREQQLYQRMAACRPALVIKLDIDLATAKARKPDHGTPELIDKIAVMSQLQFNGARLFELDTRVPYAEVFEQALRAVTAVTTCDSSSADAVA